MVRSQEFGFHIENIIRTQVHKLPPKANDTSVHDIPKEENALDPTESQSIKTTGGNYVDCADVLRIYDYNSEEKNTMILIRYSQATDKRVVDEIVELNMNKRFREILFGTARREDITALVSYVKSIPPGKRTEEQAATYKRMAKELKQNSGGWISYAPKVDSKTQRRVQCSIRDLDAFLEKYPEIVLARNKDCQIRGHPIPKEHEGFGARQRSKKESDDE